MLPSAWIFTSMSRIGRNPSSPGVSSSNWIVGCFLFRCSGIPCTTCVFGTTIPTLPRYLTKTTQARSCIAQSAQKNHLDLTNLRYRKKKRNRNNNKKLQFRCACCVRHPPPAHLHVCTWGERTLLGRPARLPFFFIRVTYSKLWRATVLEINFFFKKSRIRRTFLKFACTTRPLAGQPRRWILLFMHRVWCSVKTSPLA